MENIAFWMTIAYVIFMTSVAVWGDMKISALEHKIFLLENPGYNPNSIDGDKDGIVQEGTKWERSIN